MKAINWVRWLLAAGVCASIISNVMGRQKFRYPQPQIYKKSWPVGPRISMGNSIHLNVGPPGYKLNRPMQHKPMNFRYPPPNSNRRPPMFAVIPTWKTQSLVGPPSNQGSLPQRGPVKEFHSMNKVVDYRPEQSVQLPQSHGHIDDDKGPIHTIPAPNLSPADKPYNIQSNNLNYPSNLEYTQNFGGSAQSTVSNYVFGTQATSLTPQRITIGPTTPSPISHHYEVTESNEIGVQDYRTVQPQFFTPEFDAARLSEFATTGSQISGTFGNQALGSNNGLIGTNIQFGQQNSPMQTNLHSSLHVGFPSSAIQAQQIEQQTSDLHVGHPAPAGPPLSADQLYDLLNSFPQQFNEQYSAGQQQQVLQQQLDQLFQPGSENQFSQPQMHSFNYDEQSNKKLQQQQQQQLLLQQQQQQQIFVGQDYASGRVTADYSLEPENQEIVRKTSIPRQESSGSGYQSDNLENNIEYEETSNRNGQSTYFTQIGNDGSLTSQFYTTLPSRDAAEKLAALAAAGNVNSHLIDQLRKQQINAGSMPSNHKDDRYVDEEEIGELNESRYQQHPRYVQRNQDKDLEEKNEQEKDKQEESNNEKRPLRIMVPDLDDYSEDLDQRSSRGEADSTRGSREDYEYDDNEESQISQSSEDDGVQQSNGSGGQAVYRQNLDREFGSRLGSKSK